VLILIEESYKGSNIALYGIPGAFGFEFYGTRPKEIADRDLRADGLDKDISERNANIKALSKELED
jgi:hypothetical protein